MTPHYLRFAIVAVQAAACAAPQPPVAPASPPVTIAKPAPTEEPSGVAQGDPTEGSGPCRCSWDPKPQGVARVCRVGEQSHSGTNCVRAGRPKYGGMVLGPLPPPDLA